MTDISKLSPDVSQSYAKGLSISENFKDRYKIPLSETSFIKEHTQILDRTPRPPAVTDLMGENLKATWAYVMFPEGYFTKLEQSIYVLAPPEQLAADSKRLLAAMRQQQEGTASSRSISMEESSSTQQDLVAQPLLNLVTEISEYNHMVDAIIGLKNGFVKA